MLNSAHIFGVQELLILYPENSKEVDGAGKIINRMVIQFVKQFYIAVEVALRDAILLESHWFPYQIHSVCKYKVMISSNLAQIDCQDTSSPISCIIFIYRNPVLHINSTDTYVQIYTPSVLRK